MNSIKIVKAKANNLKNVSVTIPLDKLVVVVGKSGSGKSSLIYDVLYRASQGQPIDATVSKLPRTFAIGQKTVQAGKLSLGETNLKRLRDILAETKKGDLLIVDEPCVGMAKEDRKGVVDRLRDAVRKGVSVIVIEHQKDVMLRADHVIEFGPGAGSYGGKVVFQGTLAAFKRAKTPTSVYAFSNKAEEVDHERSPNAKVRTMRKRELVIKGINKNHVKDLTLHIPLASLVCVTGRVGTGKTTLLTVAYGATFKGSGAWEHRQGFASVDGKAHVRRSYFVDQSSLSPISTSTPATYLGIWDSIRDVYAQAAKKQKLPVKKEHFGINGKLDAKTEKLREKVTYKGCSISDVLRMTFDEAVDLFSDVPLVVRKLGFLQEVGLGYLTLGQRSNTLSGGEAQRVRLAKILSKKLGDRCLYILDTPSRGLHLSDLPVLMKVFQKIIDKNNTIFIAENREEIVRNCDTVIWL